MGGIFEVIYDAIVVFMAAAMWFAVAWLVLFSVGAVINDFILLGRRQRGVVLKLLGDTLPLAVLAGVIWIFSRAREPIDPLGRLLGAVLVLFAWGFGPGKVWMVKPAGRGE
jgi:hypothetical protein